MKHIRVAVSSSGRHRGLICMSTDTRHLKAFKAATDAIQSVSRMVRKDTYKKLRDIGD